MALIMILHLEKKLGASTVTLQDKHGYTRLKFFRAGRLVVSKSAEMSAVFTIGLKDSPTDTSTLP
jgi:hypothetical protein